MEFEQLLFEEMDDTARITLNRPESLNALSMKLSDELVEAVELIRQSTTVKFVVIRGAGDNFCVGDDIGEMIGWGNANGIMRRVRYYQNMANQLEELDKITIAAVDGYAVGGGLEITMACDFDPEIKRYTKMTLNLKLPAEFPENLKPAIIRAMDLCAVKKHIVNPPEFQILTS